MRPTTPVVALIVVFVLVLSPIASAQTLQRLITSPQQRLLLDRARIQQMQQRNLQVLATDTPLLEMGTSAQISDNAESPPAILYTMGGAVVRSDGSFNVWINGTAYDETSLPDTMRLLFPRSNGQLQIINPQNGTSYTLKSGQTLNLSTGQIFEAYQYLETNAPRNSPLSEAIEVDAGANSQQ
jgi:hypothetical protein